MAAPGEHVGKRLCKSVAHVFIEEKFHATEFPSRRSRAAANARHARMSSRVRPGKSFRISSSLIPPARYSKTSYTVILVPLTHGLPLRRVYQDSLLPVHARIIPRWAGSPHF